MNDVMQGVEGGGEAVERLVYCVKVGSVAESCLPPPQKARESCIVSLIVEIMLMTARKDGQLGSETAGETPPGING